MYMELRHSITTGAYNVTDIVKRLGKREGKAEGSGIRNAAEAVTLKQTRLIGIEANPRDLRGLRSAMLSSGQLLVLPQ
jgi:hypothetical protein